MSVTWPLASLFLNACSPSDTVPLSRVTGDVADSSGILLVTLSSSLEQIARNQTQHVALGADLVVGSGDAWFGAVADVAALSEGRFAVLDPMERKVTVFDSLGHRVAGYGREGHGPGEYVLPLALAAVGDLLVVWQPTTVSTFTVLGAMGNVVATGGRTDKGD